MSDSTRRGVLFNELPVIPFGFLCFVGGILARGLLLRLQSVVGSICCDSLKRLRGPSITTHSLACLYGMFGGAAAQRHQALRILKKAKVHCQVLRVSDGATVRAAIPKSANSPEVEEDNGSPVYDTPHHHLRAAEQHLSAVYRWLSGEASERGEEQTLRLSKELGIGIASDVEIKEFATSFPDKLPGEIFLRSLGGSAKVHRFRHPGKVFITNSRVCFYSCILDVEGAFSVQWVEIHSVRLVPNSKTTAFPVSIYLKEGISFYGTQAEQLDLHIFDFSELGNLHLCATYFLGTGLFGTWQEKDSAASVPKPLQKSKAIRTASMISPEKVLRDTSMWELERRTNPFGHDWKVPSLPHDGIAKMKWVALEGDVYKRHAFIPCDADVGKIATSEVPPVEHVDFLGQRRKCSWSTHPVDAQTDELGWQYSTDFTIGNTQWLPYCGMISFVRRRCWQPSFKFDACHGGELETGKERNRATTILQKRVPGTSNVPIYEMVFAEVPGGCLDKLAEDLERDDWKDPSSILSFYWEEMNIRSLEIGEWADGCSFTSPVKGKVRSIEMRASVPPAPMCPKDTRVQSTWHVVVLEGLVLLESITMSLDVPYGTNFNVITCDSFTAENGQLKMTRTCGIDWVQHAWTKSMIERGVPPQIAAVGQRMANVVNRWWEATGISDQIVSP